MTATVSAAATANGTPTGTVTFYDGATPLSGAVALASGIAAFTTSALTPGDHSITAVYRGDNHFNGNTGAMYQVVSKAALTVTADAASMIYGGTLPPLGYQYTGLVNGDTGANFTGALATTATSSSAAGGYPVTEGTLAAAGNYTIGTFNPGTLTINRATPTIAWPMPTAIAYGTALSSTQLDATASWTVGGTLGNVAGTFAYTPASGAVLGAGSQTLSTTFTPTDTTDYAAPTGTVPLHVNAAALTVTADPENTTYGARLPAFGYHYTGLLNGDTDASFTGGLATTASSSSPVGAYPITEGTLAATRNYTIATFSGNTLTVNPAPLTVNADAEGKTYGGAVPALGYHYTGLVNGDTSARFTGALATTASWSSAVGGYAITEGTLAATGNYAIGTFNGNTLTVSPAPLTVTADNETKVYGRPDPALTYQMTKGVLYSGDALSGELTRASGENGGTYAIQKGTVSAGDNYAITFVGGSLTVTKAAAPITLWPSMNPCVVRQKVFFQVVVSANPPVTTSLVPGVPTGRVQFFLDKRRFGAPVWLDSNGWAKSRSISWAKIGRHRIWASYLGDGNFMGSRSWVVIERVVKRRRAGPRVRAIANIPVAGLPALAGASDGAVGSTSLTLADLAPTDVPGRIEPVAVPERPSAMMSHSTRMAAARGRALHHASDKALMEVLAEGSLTDWLDAPAGTRKLRARMAGHARANRGAG